MLSEFVIWIIYQTYLRFVRGRLDLVLPVLTLRRSSCEQAEVEALLVALILDGQVDGQIDQIGKLLLLRQSSADAKKYAAAEKWANQLSQLQQTILTRLV